METELIKLKVKKKSAKGENARTIKETFINACENLNTVYIEPLIREEQYFQDLDKYRFLQSLKEEFDCWKSKGFNKTTMIKGNCEGCHLGDQVYQFYTDKLTPSFAYIIHEENDEIQDIFMCNLSNGMKTIDMGIMQKNNF